MLLHIVSYKKIAEFIQAMYQINQYLLLQQTIMAQWLHLTSRQIFPPFPFKRKKKRNTSLSHILLDLTLMGLVFKSETIDFNCKTYLIVMSCSNRGCTSTINIDLKTRTTFTLPSHILACR